MEDAIGPHDFRGLGRNEMKAATIALHAVLTLILSAWPAFAQDPQDPSDLGGRTKLTY